MGYKKAILVDVIPKDGKDHDVEGRMEELENLVSTFGSLVIAKKMQKRSQPNYKTFIGSGKLEEIMHLATSMDVDLLIIGNILKSQQLFKINQFFEKNNANIQAWDRVDLILKIFQKHAQSPEASLQIQLASIRHMGPRIFDMGIELDRQGGGIGTSGKGETNLEIMRRHLREQEKHIRKKLAKYEKVRTLHRESRKRKNLRTVGLVGYTNAGKSTLMNALTKKGVLAEDKLFATLGTSVAKMKREIDYTQMGECYKEFCDILINDTVGFIRDLPPSLIDAFSSTLEDSIESDVLLEVVDASDPKIAERITVVDEILEQIHATQKRIYVFNKIDAISDDKIQELCEQFSDLDLICISAQKQTGIGELKLLLEQVCREV